MLNKWLTETDATGSVTRVVLLDYKKAFDLIDHKLLIAKLLSYGIRSTVINNLVPRLFTYARRFGKDPGCGWSHEPPDFRGKSN